MRIERSTSRVDGLPLGGIVGAVLLLAAGLAATWSRPWRHLDALQLRIRDERVPDWIEPKIGLVFCWVGLAYVPGADPEKPAVTQSEFETVVRELSEKGKDNPRVLWFMVTRAAAASCCT